MKPRFEDCGDHAQITCPSCMSGYLHHSLVHVYARRFEDGDGILVSVRSQTEKMDGYVVAACPIDGHDLGRRDALLIDFWCECCDAKPKLLIRQHKGVTQISWHGDDDDS